MNFKQILRQLGILVSLVGFCISSSLIWAFLDYDQDQNSRIIFSIIYSVLSCLLIGAIMVILGREPDREQEMYRKEAIAVVGLGWLVCGVLGALPYLFSGVLDGIYHGWYAKIAAAIFESVSGFTTTGASIFPEPEQLPRAILFWRSLTHWLGGMGIVVLFVAILSQIGPAAKFMFNSEVPGPISESVRPRIKNTAMLLWKIYVAISLVETVILMTQGMDLFESLCHTFGTMATGGFSTRNASVGQYNHLGIEVTIIVFMVLAGMNFNLYADMIQGKWKYVLKNSELRTYLLIMLIATGMITADLVMNKALIYGSVTKALRSAGFQVVSIMTTTGFGSDDFDAWPNFSRWLLLALMFVGGSAGSTGGGIKVFRLMLFCKLVVSEIEKSFRPSLIKPIRISNQPIDDSQCRTIGVYVGMILLIAFVSTILLLILENTIDIETAFSAVAATLNNIGPGLKMVGATQNFAFMAPTSKLLLTFLMILGRLEVMAIFCLFVPNFWRK